MNAKLPLFSVVQFVVLGDGVITSIFGTRFARTHTANNTTIKKEVIKEVLSLDTFDTVSPQFFKIF
jgi:NAD(P)H-dependent flavin oxidoreductase YrpB (nitropropane dioxygenase family)